MPVPNLSRAPRVNASHIIRDISLRRRLHIVNSTVRFLGGLKNKDGSFYKGGILYKRRFISALLPVGAQTGVFPDSIFWQR
jgi:hypothetical protein